MAEAAVKRKSACGNVLRTRIDQRPVKTGLRLLTYASTPSAKSCVARNSEYRALKEFSRFMHDPDAPGMELPGMDIPGIAASYGVQSEQVKTLSELTSAVKDGLASDRPSLIEISERQAPSAQAAFAASGLAIRVTSSADLDATVVIGRLLADRES